MMDGKKCAKCGEVKPISEFALYQNRKKEKRVRGDCKSCFNAATIKRIAEDPEQNARKKARDTAWRKRNPCKVKKYKERQEGNLRIFYAKQRDELTDRYVINRLGLRVNSDIPSELIEAKRLQIKIERLLQERGHEKRSRVKGRFS